MLRRLPGQSTVESFVRRELEKRASWTLVPDEVTDEYFASERSYLSRDETAKLFFPRSYESERDNAPKLREYLKTKEAQVKKELTPAQRNLMKFPLLGAGVAGGYGATMLAADALRKDRGLRQAWRRMSPKGKARAVQLAMAAAGTGTLAGGALRARLREDEVRKELRARKHPTG